MQENAEKRQRLASCLLVLWALICLSNIVFRHSHKLPDGRIVTHVHPYAEFGSKCPFPAHHHTQSELLWLDCISNIPFDSFIPTLSFFVPEPVKAPRMIYSYIEHVIDAQFCAVFLRGPPFNK